MYNDQSNALGEFIFQSKYARYNSNLKRKETFEESVDRILQMHLKHLKDKYPEVLNNIVPHKRSAEEVYVERRICWETLRALSSSLY